MAIKSWSFQEFADSEPFVTAERRSSQVFSIVFYTVTRLDCIEFADMAAKQNFTAVERDEFIDMSADSMKVKF